MLSKERASISLLYFCSLHYRTPPGPVVYLSHEGPQHVAQLKEDSLGLDGLLVYVAGLHRCRQCSNV